MHAWAPVTIASAALLVVTGILKLRTPGPTVTALRSVGLHWAGGGIVRAFAAVEISVGVAATVIGDPVTDLCLSALYLGFTGFLIRALRTPTASCGCAGNGDTPPTLAHAVLTVTFAGAAIAAATVGDPTGVASGGPGGRVEVVTALALAGLLAWLGWALLTLSPRLTALRRT
jgi:hypothetical protein